MDEKENLGNKLLITLSNQKKNVHYINLQKLVPKVKQINKFRYIPPIFKSRNISFNYSEKNEDESKKENNKNENMKKITLINMSALDNLYSEKDIYKRNNSNLIDNDKKTGNVTIKNIKKINIQKKDNELIKDSVYAFFSRNFYDNEIPISKKIELNQKVLNYYLQDKDKREKYKRSKLEDMMYKKYRYVNLKKLLDKEKKNDIKTSLILDDYSLYNKIHRIVRFWGKFTNYACPIFQVQKANLNLEKPKKDKKKYLFQNDFIKKNCSAKHFKLPVLYTNSTRTMDKFENKKFKFMNKK